MTIRKHNKLYIAIITNKPKEEIKTLQTLHCVVPHKIVFCRAKGFANARNKAISKEGLNVQLNDDLVLSPGLWQFTSTVKRGEFAFQLAHEETGDRPCSRVFIIHQEDFSYVGGFNEKLKYFFEDGDFYYRALAKGLKFRVIPDDVALHISHKHAFYTAKLAVESEAAKVYVMYGQRMMPFKYVDRFFIPFRDYHVALQHLVLRVLFMVYWITRSCFSFGKFGEKIFT
jgi:hypothetical protein